MASFWLRALLTGVGLFLGSVQAEAGSFTLTAPDVCENGAVCPVGITANPALVGGDSFVITINGEAATGVKVLSGSVTFFSTRLKTPSGQSVIEVRCVMCNATRAPSKRVIQTVLSGGKSSKNSIPGQIRVRVKDDDFRVLVAADETASGWAFFDTEISKVLVAHSPYTVKNPYFAIKGSLSGGNSCFGFSTAELSVQCTGASRGLSVSPDTLAMVARGLTNLPTVATPRPNVDAIRDPTLVAEIPLDPPQRKPQPIPNIRGSARLALIIGNDVYKNVPRLKNAVHDSEAISSLLGGMGYEIFSFKDLGEKEFKRALRDFKRRLKGGEEVVFFFAGHGVQIDNANYLLPTDVGNDSNDQIRDEAIPLQRVLDDFSESKVKFSLAMVDACRDNPFKSSGRSIGGRGLAATSAATGQMIIFSAGSGQQALDRLGANDKQRNGLFTRVLVETVENSKEPIHILMRDVRTKVARLANSVGHEQVPAIYDQAIGDFYFAPR